MILFFFGKNPPKPTVTNGFAVRSLCLLTRWHLCNLKRFKSERVLMFIANGEVQGRHEIDASYG